MLAPSNTLAARLLRHPENSLTAFAALTKMPGRIFPAKVPSAPAATRALAHMMQQIQLMLLLVFTETRSRLNGPESRCFMP